MPCNTSCRRRCRPTKHTSQLLRLMQGTVERFRLTIDQLTTDVSRLQQAQQLPAE